MKTLIADDEPVARQGIERLVRQTPFLQLTGEARHTVELSELLARTTVDLLFLDIQMPGTNGIDWLRHADLPPLVIFTTAYSRYALQGFELNAVDYLLKPVTAERFYRAAEKALELFTLRAQPYFFVKADRQQKKILFDDILFIEGLLNYVIIHTEQQKIITYVSMKKILSNLPVTQFLQVHKSYIVSLNKVSHVGKDVIFIRHHQLPVSRHYKPVLEIWLAGKRLS